jgi:hypothetical protein
MDDSPKNIDDFMIELKNDDLAWNKKHPILLWIDHLFKDKAIGYYRPSYSITHPWTMVKYGWNQMRYAWQRVFRGWDETVIWSIDYHLAEMIPVWLMKLKEEKQGVPSMLFGEGDDYVDENGVLTITDAAMERAEKEYNAILDKIALGFTAWIKMDSEDDWKSPEYFQHETEFNEALDLFKKYFGTFWD